MPARATRRSQRTPSVPALRRVLGGFAAVAVLLIGILAASPEAHTLVHPDANQPGHFCAVSLASLGFCDTAATPPVVLPAEAQRIHLADTPTGFRWTAPKHWHSLSQAPPRSA